MKAMKRAVLTDVSKAFDCSDHNLLMAKLSACGFEKQLVHFIYSYLKNALKYIYF